MEILKIFRKTYLLSIALISILTSCEKFVQVAPPRNNLTSSVIFADSASATTTILGVYAKFMANSNYFGTGGITLYTGLAGDELYNTTSSSVDVQFYSNNVTSTTGTVDVPLFQTPYIVIYQTNACIEGLNLSGTLPVSVKSQLLGEAKLMRAFIYFNLCNLYGPVPLVATTNYTQSAEFARTPVDSVYSFIVHDLLDASTLLTAKYPSQGKVRPNLFAAYALLARIYLYQKNWAQAEAFATKVISSNSYSLEPNLNSVFLATSKEAIWQLQPVAAGTETLEGTNFLPSSGTVLPKYVISTYLLNAFDSGDLRRVSWLKSNTVAGKIYNYPFKYKLGRDNNTNPVEDYMILRLAEQYLIRAEAKGQQGLDLPGAISDLNVVRVRAGLPAITPTTQSALLDSIYHENQVELFCEWGHRWFDLKRLSMIDSVLGTEKPNWKSYKSLLPIPFSQIQANPFLNQNPGY